VSRLPEPTEEQLLAVLEAVQDIEYCPDGNICVHHVKRAWERIAPLVWNAAIEAAAQEFSKPQTFNVAMTHQQIAQHVRTLKAGKP